MTATFGGFGNPTTSAPAFGTAGSTGFGFGATPAAATGNTGFGFGTTPAAPASNPGFGFGTTPAPTGGASFGFGTTPATTSAGFGFGTTPAAAGTSGFSFGQPAATTSSTGFSFGFGNPTATTSANPAFSFTNPTTTQPFSFTSFGQPAKTTSSFSFGGIGAQTSTTPAGFSFGQSTMLAGTLTGTALPGVTGPSPDNSANLFAALSNCMIYGDERDSILLSLNQLLASWGTGKAYFSTNAPPVEITQGNPFCRFKAIGYSCIPASKLEDGLVSLIFNKKEDDIRNTQAQFIDHLHKCFGSKPNIAVCVDALKALPDDQTEMVIFLQEKSLDGTTRRIPPSEICTYLEQATVKPQLQTIGVIHVSAKAALSKEQLQLYLESPPVGIDPFVWQHANIDNPNPEKLIPVPLIGFDNLNRRIKCQENETNQHQKRLDIISDDIVELNRKRANSAAKIAECKRKLIDLQHRVLKVMVRQEVARKMGLSILEDEEQLRIKLEAIQAELNAPTQFKGHLKELISQIRMQNFQTLLGGQKERYNIDETTKEKVKEHLHLQQEGISHLINIIKEDIQDLKTIDEVSKEMISKQR